MKTTRGFSLIELMIAVAILAIVLGLGVPAFRDLIQNNRAATITNDVVSALQIARSEAVKRGQLIMVCSLNDAGNNCENDTNWAQGWLVINNATAPPTPLKVWDAPGGNPGLTASANNLTFQPNGRAIWPPSVPPVPSWTLTVALPGCTGNQQRTITVGPTGQVTTARSACP